MLKFINNKKEEKESIEDLNFRMQKLSEFTQNEFPESVTEEFSINDMPPLSRRKFIALLGASTAFAATSCNDYRDKGEIVPYNNKPVNEIPGVANYYASAVRSGAETYGILIKTREGRPVKIDGNPDNPLNMGKINTKIQASVMNLYDPERIESPKLNENGKPADISWEKADKDIIDNLKKASTAGSEIALILNTAVSPTQYRLLNEFKAKYPTAKIYSYELFDDSERQKAWKKSYNNGTYPLIKWNDAKIILALESDFLGTEGNVPEQARLYTETRNIDDTKKFSRLYSAEGSLTVTGMLADYRFRLTPEKQLQFILSIMNELAKRKVIKPDPEINPKISTYNLDDFIKENNFNGRYVKLLVDDLADNKGRSIIYAGDKLPESVHIAVNLLNELLENTSLYRDRKTVRFIDHSSYDDLKELTAKMNSGKVGLVINFDTNPVFHFERSLEFGKSLKNVPIVISLLENENETSQLSKYILPVNHDLESWGDFQSATGIVSLQQPVINPLYHSRQKEALLLHWMNEGKPDYSGDIYHKYLKSNWQENYYTKLNILTAFEKFWFSALHDGFITFDQEKFDKITTAPEDMPGESPIPVNEIQPAAGDGIFETKAFAGIKPTEKSGFTVILRDNFSIGDGRYANNGWLQELPHPVTKVAWDNFASIAPGTAAKLGLDMGDMISISVNGAKLEIPVVPQPGTAEDLVSIELGYGRKHAGIIGSDVGFNANILKNSMSEITPWILTGAEVENAGKSYKIVSTQEHHSLDDTFTKDFHKIRRIIRDVTVSQYEHDPKFIHHEDEPIFSITEGHQYKDVKWGMAIDLNKCISCNACTASCNVENNVPIVGKEQVGKGREMHWIRIDRYYSGTPEEPDSSLMPMLCQHCDNAPCENVCPVAATTHSPDGLNQMAYNRCVGTRYCANNCPYKVRRFNFHDFRRMEWNRFQYSDSLKLMMNPEVTVRSVGVMEKCTFCIQRIMEKRQVAIQEGRAIKGSDVTTACQDACPTEAIYFGDLNDPKSSVSRMRDHNLGYHVLDMLNVRPNVTYIAKLKNTHSEENYSEQ